MRIWFTLIHKLLSSCWKDNILIPFNTWANNSLCVNKWILISSFLYSSCSYSSNMSCDNTDYVVTMLQNEQLRNLGLIPGRGKRYSFVQSIHTNSGATQPPTQCIRGELFLGDGGMGDHSPPPRAEGMKEWSHTSNTPLAFMDYVGTTLLHCTIKRNLIFSLPKHVIWTVFLLCQ